MAVLEYAPKPTETKEGKAEAPIVIQVDGPKVVQQITDELAAALESGDSSRAAELIGEVNCELGVPHKIITETVIDPKTRAVIREERIL